MPSPVRVTIGRFVYWRKQKKKQKRDHSSSVDAQTRAKMFQNSETFSPKKPMILLIELNFSFDQLILPRIIPLISAYLTFLYDFYRIVSIKLPHSALHNSVKNPALK